MSERSDSDSIGRRAPKLGPDNWLATLAQRLVDARLRHALIGGQAVNAWLLPRGTDDYDFVVDGQREPVERFLDGLKELGLVQSRRQDEGGRSGPDFAQFRDSRGTFQVDVQVSKTEFQDGIIRRAQKDPLYGLSVATAEDLLLLKLLAMRGKDQRDIAQLIDDRSLDGDYIEHWLDVLEVRDRWREFKGLA